MDLIGRFFPGMAARWYAKRAALANAQRLYQAATSDQYHPRRGDARSGNAVMEHARDRVRNWGRYLDENSDLAVGALDDLTDRVVGAGITVEPMPRRRNGEVNSELADVMARAWTDWGRKPETSQVTPWGELQRLVFRSQMRDGEVLGRHLEGARGYRWPTPVRYALDVLEADYLPFDFIARDQRIIHGVERDDFGTHVAYHILTQHPGEFFVPMQPAAFFQETMRVPSDQVIHLRFTRRLGQIRGISVFHPCVQRLQDLKEYEESERLAARIAASFSAVITKSPDTPGSVGTTSTGGARSLEMSPAMIFDDLLPGESVETIDSNRPSNALSDYRAAMLRAVSAGTGARYSTIARTWDSSYTAMRQETVQTLPGTQRMQDYFVAQFIRRVYERWVQMSMLSDVFNAGDADPLRLMDADYRGPGIPWIDPDDEVDYEIKSVNNGFKSRSQVIRERGGDPRKVDAELAQDTFVPRTTDADADAEVGQEDSLPTD